MNVVPLYLKRWLARRHIGRVRLSIIIAAALAAAIIALAYRQLELRAALATGGEPGASFADCATARSAGVAPLLRGLPGYSARLDPDGDGVACE